MLIEKMLTLPVDHRLLSEDTKFINSLLQAAISNQYSFSLYRLPSDNSLYFIVDFTGNQVLSKIEMEHEKGFIFNTFDPEFPSFFIKADLYFNLSKQLYRCDPESETAAKKFFNQVAENLSNPTSPAISSFLPELIKSEEVNAQEFKSKILKAIDLINDGELKKVVLARSKQVPIPSDFSYGFAFSELAKDKSAFVSLTHIANEGIWMGASPELLVSIDENKIFKTVALAGTQIFSHHQEISKAVWTQKEIEEQALVGRYIINCFKTIRLREYDEDGPRTVRAGSLIHLKTLFSVDMKEVNFPSLGSDMLRLLHPTSAVCGMPRESAMEFILQNEDLDRKFYAGFLGPVNLENETHIFVNIRCAEFGNDCANLYSGAGITQESDPEKEFAETELKMKMMERIISGKTI